MIKADIDIIKESFDRLVKRHELEETTKNFDNFVRLEEFQDIEQ